MRLHRVYTPHQLEPGLEVRIEGRPAHYLSRVLRVTAGQRIVLFNGDGHDYAAEVIRAGSRELFVSVASRLPAVRESNLHITVVQAISRGERMDQTLQKCTELGVNSFQPLFSERVEVRLKGEKLDRRVTHWQAVVAAACGQCGRAVVPAVSSPLTLDDWLNSGPSDDRLVLAPGSDQALAGIPAMSRVELLAGPEGGFSEEEMSRISFRNVRPVSLGPRVLRTETAAAAAVAVLQARHGDFR